MLIHFKSNVTFNPTKLKTVIIREGNSYEMMISYPISNLFYKIVSAIVINDKKLMLRAYVRDIFPTDPNFIKKEIDYIRKIDIPWLISQGVSMDTIVDIDDMLYLLLHEVAATEEVDPEYD